MSTGLLIDCLINNIVIFEIIDMRINEILEQKTLDEEQLQEWGEPYGVMDRAKQKLKSTMSLTQHGRKNA